MKRFLFLFLLLTLGAMSCLHADDIVRAVQTRLKAGGFYFGDLNGRYDSETAAGLTRYQIRNGLQITGKLDAQTRYALGVTETKPKVPMPRLGEDVWRYLRKSDQAAIRRLMAEDASKQKPSKKAGAPASPAAASVALPSPRPAPLSPQVTAGSVFAIMLLLLFWPVSIRTSGQRPSSSPIASIILASTRLPGKRFAAIFYATMSAGPLAAFGSPASSRSTRLVTG